MNLKTKILSSIPAICVMVGIFYFSSQTAIESSGLSSNITEKILSIMQDLFYIQQDTTIGSVFFHIIEIIIRKAAHITEYAILSITIAYALYAYGRRRWKLILWSEVVSIIYAITDEFHQLFIPGRSGQITDVFIDGCGAFIGCFIFIIISNLITRKIKTLKNRRI